MRPSASHIKVGGVCEVEIHVHQSQLSDDTSGDISSSNSNYISTEVSASLMKDKFLVTAITLEEDSEEHLPQSKLNELLKVKQLSKIFLKTFQKYFVEYTSLNFRARLGSRHACASKKLTMLWTMDMP